MVKREGVRFWEEAAREIGNGRGAWVRDESMTLGGNHVGEVEEQGERAVVVVWEEVGEEVAQVEVGKSAPGIPQVF